MSKQVEHLSIEEQQAIAEFEEKLQSSIGLETGPFSAWDPVNRPMIRHWCEAMGDKNAAYCDPEVAATLGAPEGAILAPATMMQAWTMLGYSGEHPPGSDTREAMPMMPLCDEHGYVAVVATNCEQEYLQPVCEGDELSGYSKIESISEQKSTALGIGYFITQVTEYRNQHDQVVGTMRFRILKYKPHQT